jgi:predicted CoA-binding protein
MDEREIARSAKVIAVVGISNKPDRSSFGVAEYLAKHAEILPVNPNLKEWQGRPCYGSLAEIPQQEVIDIVDIFRRSEDVMPVVEEAIARGNVKCIWMQQGIVNEAAAEKARAAGMEVVMDACLAVVHSTAMHGKSFHS